MRIQPLTQSSRDVSWCVRSSPGEGVNQGTPGSFQVPGLGADHTERQLVVSA